MFYIYTSNQLEQLKNQYANIVSTPPNDVFIAETVVVQNAGMARWLSMEMADISGISANTEFLFPAEFMWRILRLVATDTPEHNQCSPEILRFHILEELSLHYVDYSELQHYIMSGAKVNPLATWELSCKLSQLFDQYLFYRSNWIRDWEANDWDSSNNWQSRLWQRCVKNKGLIHWLSIQDQFTHSLAELDVQLLPQRISFFSMSALSPGYLDLLGEIAQRTDIHLYIINPCEDVYWGDIQSQKSRAKLDKDEQTYIDVGNPLLASMGKQGRDFITKLLDIPNAEHYPALKHQQDTVTLLNQIQHDIYNLQEPQPLKFQSDSSIQFNACHTRLREVEVLHDQILSQLDSDYELAPSDIGVMMPDIEKYAPYIEAVFSNSEQKLPFSIADREPQNVFSIIEALNTLFILPETRFDVEAVFQLLEYEDIRTQFNLDKNQLDDCRELARATNIRWGISAKTRTKNNLPNTEEHTWKYAMDRMLLGYAIADSEQGELLFDSDRNLSLLAYSEIEGSNGLVLSNFKRFTDTVFTIGDWQHKSYSLERWLNKTKQLLKQLIPENNDQQRILIDIADLESQALVAEFTQELSFSVYQKILKQCLQNITANEKYLGYGITFCALVPMRSVPFKVIALMGMNDGEFPRQDKRPSFDLMANNTKKGDRSRRAEDRYLFLESILAARSKLIISYIGQSVKDNSEFPPSILVNELLDTIAISSGKSAKEWIINHPLQAFNPRYFSSNEGYNTQSLFSYVKQYTSLKKSDKISPGAFIKEPLETLDDSSKNITLNELIAFFKSPARTFLKHRFAIQTFDDNITLAVREPFTLEPFKDKELRNLILEPNANATDKQLIARAKGLLPYGQIGDQIYQKEKQITETLISQLPDFETISSKDFSLALSGLQLKGKIDQLTAQGRLVQQTIKPYAGDYISLWINHLALNLCFKTETETAKTTSFYSPEVRFTLKPVEDAKQKLTKLLDYYWQGLSYPLEFFPKTSLELFVANGTENTSKITDKWNGNDHFAGEKDRFENWLLHRNLDINKDNQPAEFVKISRDFFRQMFESLEEIK